MSHHAEPTVLLEQELERQAGALAASEAAAASAEEQHAAAEDQLRSQLMRSEAECERLQVRCVSSYCCSHGRWTQAAKAIAGTVRPR